MNDVDRPERGATVVDWLWWACEWVAVNWLYLALLVAWIVVPVLVIQAMVRRRRVSKGARTGMARLPGWVFVPATLIVYAVMWIAINTVIWGILVIASLVI